MTWYDIMFWELSHSLHIKIEESCVNFVLVQHSTCCILCGTIGIVYCQAVQIHALQCHPNTGVAHFEWNSEYVLVNLACIMYDLNGFKLECIVYQFVALIQQHRWHGACHAVRSSTRATILTTTCCWESRAYFEESFSCCRSFFGGYQMPQILSLKGSHDSPRKT